MSRQDFKIQCPFCFEHIWMEFYPEDGLSQQTVIDCEVCCNPILYQVDFTLDEDGEYQTQVVASRS